MPFIEWEEAGDRYRVHILEAGQGETLVLCHGFTGSAENWRSLLERLSSQRRVIAVDLPGHGQTDVPAAAFSMDGAIRILARVLDHLNLAQVDLLGYSMGGRFALSFACQHPARVRRLILESASPGLRTPEERATRKASDDALAQRIEAQGVPAFVDFWEALPLWASQRSLPQASRAELRQQRLRNHAAGLAGSLRGMGTGIMPPLWDALPALTQPVLLIVGEADSKFRAINREMHSALPNSLLVTIPGAGHTVHLESLDDYQATVTKFLVSH